MVLFSQIEEALRFEQIAYNTTQDEDLKGKLKDLMDNVHKPIILEISEFLRKESVSLPPVTPEKPMPKEREPIPQLG